MSNVTWALRALALPDVRRDDSRADPFDAFRRRLGAHGYAAAERKLDGETEGHLPSASVVELRRGQLAIVRGHSARAMDLETEAGHLRVDAGRLGEVITGRALVVYPAPGRSIARTLWHLADAGFRRLILDILGVSVMLRGLLVAVPLLTREALQRAIPNNETSTLWFIATSMVLGGVLIGAGHYWRSRSARHIEMHVTERFSRELFVKLLRQPFQSAESRAAGGAWEEFGAAEHWLRLTAGQVVSWIEAALAGVFLVALAWVSPISAALAAGASVVALALTWAVASAQLPIRQNMLEARSRRQQFLLERLEKVETVRAENLGKSTCDRMETIVREGLQAELQLGGNRARQEGISQAYERVVFVGAYLLLGWRTIAGQMDIADMLAAIQLVTVFGISFRAILSLPEQVVALRALTWRLDEVLVAPEPHAASAEVRGRAAGGYAVELDQVSFRHDDASPWTLRDYSLRVRHGEHATLRWPSGSGKTTLLRLVAGLYAPASGAVRLGGEGAAGQGAVCYVPQAARLLDGSIMDNLKVFSGGAATDRILAAARATGFRSFVEGLPMQWRTVLTGGGQTLSSGERQLLLLTAAAASSCPIVLLDEAMAHVDSESRRTIAAANLFRNRTVISVEHDSRMPRH
jgi:ABC-type bacteriocin/lantibiotic exporter with double-glycine peptidase domain